MARKISVELSLCGRRSVLPRPLNVAALSVSSNAWRPLPELAGSAYVTPYTNRRQDRTRQPGIDDDIIIIERSPVAARPLLLTVVVADDEARAYILD